MSRRPWHGIQNGQAKVKHFTSLPLVLACALTGVVLSGCGQKPSGKSEISSTNAPTLPVATGTFADGPADLPVISNSIPLRTIGSLNANIPAGARDSMVRLRGTVLDEQPGEFIVIHDSTGTIFAETHQAVLPKVRELVDLQGQPAFDIYPVGLKNAVAVPVMAGDSTNQMPSAASPGRPACHC